MSDWIPRLTLGSLPAPAAEKYDAREALFFSGARWRLAELSLPVAQAARGLMATGIAHQASRRDGVEYGYQDG